MIASSTASNIPLLLVLAISIVIGLLMVIVFRYTSDQKAIGRAKDKLKAHLLAVRLFQDQLPVVMRAYGRILHGTGSYLRLACTPFLIAILPITFLIVQLDRYFGWVPLQPAQAFLVEARVEDPAALSEASLVAPGLARISPLRLRRNFWERMFTSGEPALADNSPVQSIAINYPPRVIGFAWMEWNWIVLFFVVSLIAGFIFKSVLGINL
jgi:hypothetical protein